MGQTTNTPNPPPRRHPASKAIPIPPPTAEEQRESEHLIRQLNDLAAMARQRNLMSAVALAQQAAAGKGDLIAHFCELGRRFGHTLRSPEKARTPPFRVIEGGAA